VGTGKGKERTASEFWESLVVAWPCLSAHILEKLRVLEWQFCLMLVCEFLSFDG
jgi:hypothetical protein